MRILEVSPVSSGSDWLLPFPRVLRIEPAGACNLTCSHCPTGTVDMARGLMDWRTFRRVMHSVAMHRDMVKVIVLYHGGEPLLNKRFFDMVRAAKRETAAMVKTVSNGTVMSERIATDFVASGLDIVEFSIDGESPAQNDFIRRGARYTRLLANIRTLIAAKEEASALTPAIFLSTTQFIAPRRPRREQTAKAPRFLTEEFARELKAGKLAGIKAAFSMRWPHMTVLDEVYDVYFDPEDKEIRNTCDHVINTVTVRWNGDVVACCYDLTSRAVMGNVNDSDLEAIWNNREYRSLRQSIADTDFIPLCANCNVVKPHAYLVMKEPPI